MKGTPFLWGLTYYKLIFHGGLKKMIFRGKVLQIVSDIRTVKENATFLLEMLHFSFCL